MHLLLQIDKTDNVAVALHNIEASYTDTQFQITIRQFVKQKQKVTLKKLKKQEPIIMYGVTVGVATQDFLPGELLTETGIAHKTEEYSTAKKEPYTTVLPTSPVWQNATFNGYKRTQNQFGTRNYWLVIPLVFCENNNIQVLQQAFETTLGFSKSSIYKQRVELLSQHFSAHGHLNDFTFQETYTEQPKKMFAQVDGVKFLTHQMGCGGSRSDAKMLCELLAAYVNHPNVGGATILSLGCQNATIQWFKEALYKINPNFSKPLFIEEQQSGTNHQLLTQAIDSTFRGLVEINNCFREATSINNLVLGLKCGGSDGFSGISANPALGHASDILVGAGGSSILAEFPELCGVEQQIINRCTSHATAQKFESLMRDYAQLSESFGNPFSNNPSAGNIADGLLTDAMKSAGAAKKAGHAPIVDALNYAEPLTQKGLNVLCTPGNDVEATTGIAASGATITVFTTGLGTPTGNPITPTIKVSSNSTLFSKMPDVIDFDCGGIIANQQSIEECGVQLLYQIIQTANGTATKAELLHQDDFIPWKKSISV